MLSYVAAGMSDREIAECIHRSPHTVKHHIERHRHKIDVRNRMELAAWAGQNGYYWRCPRPSGDRAPSATLYHDEGEASLARTCGQFHSAGRAFSYEDYDPTAKSVKTSSVIPGTALTAVTVWSLSPLP
jgi:hypothetical protein